MIRGSVSHYIDSINFLYIFNQVYEASVVGSIISVDVRKNVDKILRAIIVTNIYIVRSSASSYRVSPSTSENSVCSLPRKNVVVPTPCKNIITSVTRVNYIVAI